MTTKCVDQEFPCQDLDYLEFDRIAHTELSDPISCSDLVNGSSFCTELPLDESLTIGDLNHKIYLKTLGNNSGLYHLWIDYDHCDDHQAYTMLCVYVGKGFAGGRIDNHIKNKWPDATQLYVTFTEMENRLAKYYEQLFLDVYSFELNRNENAGQDYLYGVWDEERHDMGTQMHEVSKLSKVRSLDDI